MESIRRKYVRLINSGSNKVCVVSLTNFLIFLNYVNLNQFWEKKIIKKMKNHDDQNFLNFVGGLNKRLYGNINKIIMNKLTLMHPCLFSKKSQICLKNWVQLINSLN